MYCSQNCFGDEQMTRHETTITRSQASRGSSNRDDDDDDDDDDDREDLDRRIREGAARGRDVDKEKTEYRRRYGNPCRWVNGRVVCIH